LPWHYVATIKETIMPHPDDVMVVKADAVYNLRLALKSWDLEDTVKVNSPLPWGDAPIADWMGSRGYELSPYNERWLSDLADQVVVPTKPSEEEDIYSWLNDTPLPAPIQPISMSTINAAVAAYVERNHLCGCDVCVRSLQHHVNRYLRTHPNLIASMVVEQAIERCAL
jgi:hypothetical protein